MKDLSFKKFKKDALKNVLVKKEYDALDEEFAIIDELITRRKEAHLTQQQIAVQLHTKQSAIARLESGGFKNSSIATLTKYARAVGCSVHIKLVKQAKKNVKKDNL
jgi:transcriptional regulator with XRE-family HTH domain